MQDPWPALRRASPIALLHPDRVRPLLAACLLLHLGAAGCRMLSYPDEPVATTEEIPVTDPHVASEVQPAAWVELSAAGRDALRVRDYPAAESNFVAALAETAMLPDYDTRVHTALGNVVRMAALYQSLQLWDDAQRVVSLVVTNAEAGRRADFDAAAPVLTEQARHQESLGHVAQAIDIYQATLLLRGADSGRQASTRLRVQQQIASAYVSAGQPERAVPLLEQVCDETTRVRGATSEAAGKAYSQLAVAQDRSGDFTAAEASFQHAISIQEALDPEGIDMALVQNEAAMFYLTHDRNDQALEHAQKSAANLEIHGVEGGALASVLDTLALAESRLGRTASAELHWKRAIDALEKADPATRSRLSSVLTNYAAMLRSLGRSGEARQIEAKIAQGS